MDLVFGEQGLQHSQGAAADVEHPTALRQGRAQDLGAALVAAVLIEEDRGLGLSLSPMTGGISRRARRFRGTRPPLSGAGILGLRIDQGT
jgi:hypothetical protein